MRQAAEKRQVYLTSKSRPLTPQDLSTFDYLIGMDAKNVADMQVSRPRVCFSRLEFSGICRPSAA